MKILEMIDKFIDKNSEYFEDAADDEELMEYTTQPFFYSQRATKKRLKDSGIVCKTKVISDKGAVYGAFGNIKMAEDGPNRVESATRNVTVKRQYVKDGKKLFSERKKEILDISILKFKTKGCCECPNCGAVGKTESFIDGCDYCGKSLAVKDFEPKISSYSLTEDIEKLSKRACIRAAAICSLIVIGLMAVFVAGCAFQIGGQDDFGLRQMVNGMYFIPFAVRQLLVCGFCFLVIYGNVSNESRIEDEKVLTDKVNISVYEFVENLELRLKTIYLAQNLKEAGVYSITNIDDFVKERTDVVECQLVKVKFTFAQKKAMYTTIAGQATVKVYRLVGERIKKYYEKVDFECKSRNDNGEPVKNVLNVYKCKKCGDTVDIVDGGKCRSCGTMLEDAALGFRFTKLEAAPTKFEKIRGIFLRVFKAFIIVLGINLVIPTIATGYNAFSTAKMVFGMDEAINGFYDEVPLPQESQDIQLIKDDSARRDVTRHIEYKVQDVDKVLEQYIGVIKDAGYKVYDKEAYSKINSEYEFTADYEFRMHKKFYAQSGDIVVCVKLDRTNGRIILDMKMCRGY